MKLERLIFCFFFITTTISCQKATELPEVITREPIRSDYDVTLKGEVISTGDDITTRGVCWSNSPNPNTDDDNWQLDSQRGLGEFSITVEGIEANNNYFFKAFAVNSLGISYGEELKFRGPYDNVNNALVNSRGCIECDNYSVGDTFLLEQNIYVVADISMLTDAISSGEDLTKFCTSKITNMKKLFQNRNNFNQNISSWDVSNVTRMEYCFDGATSFNADIGNWDVGNVNNSYSMFRNAESFNQDIGNWEVSLMTNMIFMFFNATSFNQDLSQWCVPDIISTPNDFSTNSALSVNNLPVWGTCP